MRIIRFRGYNEINKKMLNWNELLDTNLKNIFTMQKKDTGIILMQFTGLKDKNGKEIYEGDIVLYEDWEMATENGSGDSFINKGIVGYCEENCRFYVTEKQTILDEDVFYEGNEDLEVIGNIYDNLELLEKEGE